MFTSDPIPLVEEMQRAGWSVVGYALLTWSEDPHHIYRDRARNRQRSSKVSFLEGMTVAHQTKATNMSPRGSGENKGTDPRPTEAVSKTALKNRKLHLKSF